MAAPRDQGFRANDGIVLRTPLLPMDELLAWTNAGNLVDQRGHLAALIDRPEVREALYVASPSLSGAIEKWRVAPDSAAGQRVESSLCKYVARMAGRSTPFGLFSAVSAGKLGKTTDLRLAPRGEYRRRTRLDNDYLFLLVGELLRAPEVRDALLWKPNTSIYRIAGRLRYAAARLDGKERSYHLVSVEPTEYLDATLARAARGAKLADLAAPLIGDDITLDDARAYVGELVDAQLLVPELGVHVTGPEPIDGIIAQLAAAGIEGPRAVLAEVRAAIAAIDGAGVGNAPERYVAIAKRLEELPAKVDMSLLFQVDMVKPAAATLGTRVAADLAHVITQIYRVGRYGETAIDDFKRSFQERWEGREVSLAEALDEESGIGFEAARGPGSEGSPLLAGLAFPPGAPQPQRVGWGRVETIMLRKLGAALASGADEIVLDDKDIDDMDVGKPARLPDAFAAMFRIAGTAEELAKGELSILFEGASGPSGARLLGRFCHASPEIDAMVRAHHAAEEALRPDAIFAEVVHLNEGRIGNILCRPVLRAHEIVFLGVSGAPDEQRITLDDLMVSVVGDRILLRSKRLGKEVIPRLTTAHNFRLRSLGVYRFLCALASQGVEMPNFSLGPGLGELPYVPRLRLGRVVLRRAAWKIQEKELAAITTAVREAQKEPKKGGPPGPSAEEKRAKILGAVAALREARRLPRFFVIAAGDNELPIDLDNPLLALAFADEAAGAPRVELLEMYPAPDRLVAHGPEGAFADELVVTFTRTRDATPPRAIEPAPAIVRRFVPGSEWLYAKLYCGESTGDRVLRDVVAPVVRDAMANGDADQWFFIRYADPDPHVRVRLHGDPARLAANVLPALHRAAEPLLDAGAVRKIVLDTYERELERYGGDRGIELVEQLFWRDSEAILGIVELLDGDAGGDARWRLAVRGIDSMLDALGFDADARLRVMTAGRDMLGVEHNANADFWGRIGDRFTKERASLETVFARDPARDAEHDLEPGFALLAARDEHLRPIGAELRARDAAGELHPKLDDLAWSLCHMHANRILHASQRAQEMVIYDFVRRLHAARKARARSEQRA